MKKNLIFWVVVFASLAVIVYSSEQFNSNVNAGVETFDNLDNFTGTCGAGAGQLEITTDLCSYNIHLINLSTNTNNWTVLFKNFTITNADSGDNLIFFSGANGSYTSAQKCRMTGAGTQIMQLRCQDLSNYATIQDLKADGTRQDNVSIVWLTNNSVLVKVNGTTKATVDLGLGDQASVSNATWMMFNQPAVTVGLTIDEMVVFNGTEYSTSSPPPPPGTFIVTAKDLYDGTSLDNLTVTIVNSTYTTTNSTSSGSLSYTGVTNGFYNITVYSNQSGGYFNVTYSNYNVSTNLVAELYQAVLYVNASEVVTGDKISNFWASVTSQKNESNSTGWAKLLLKAGDYNLTVNASGYLDAVDNISLSALEEKTFTAVLGTHRLTINASEYLSGTPISNFTLNLTGINVTYAGSKSTTSGSLSFDLVLGNYSAVISSTGYAPKTANITVDEVLENYTFRVFVENSIYIRIFSEDTGILLNGTNATVDFDSDVAVFTEETQNGTVYVEDVTPTTYTIDVSAVSYDSRTYFITMQSGTNVELDAYLQTSLTSQGRVFTIVDTSTSKVIEGVLVSVSKKVNLTYVTVAQAETDVSGSVLFELDKDTEYRVTLSKDGYETRVFDLTPIFSSYTIEITPEATIDFSTIYSVVDYVTFPTNKFLSPSEFVNFSIVITSLDGTVIEYFGLNTSSYITNVSTSPSGGTAQITLNLSNFTGVWGVTYFVSVDGRLPVTIDRSFYFSNVTAGNQSLTKVIEEYEENIGITVKSIIAVAFTIIIMATFASLGIRDRRLNVIGATWLGFFMLWGWLPTVITIAVMTILLASFFIGGIEGTTDG